MMIMEVLSKLLEHGADYGKLQLHPQCSAPRLTHLLFVDDLLVVSDGSRLCLTVIKEIMKNFKGMCGLDMNVSKSEISFGGCWLRC